ncbi:uncharacterized protein LOC142409049 [Mycteria americana]|uniref:uncharacterized protein LOC142409049 n=1 Tax=Mycteria americana TaxID=33587 RepID=UPI003F588397
MPAKCRQLPLMCNQKDPEWPWSQAHIKYNGIMGIRAIKENLNLATVVVHGAEVFSRHEWSWDNGWLPLLKGKAGEEIQVGCRMINGSPHEKVTSMTISSISRNPIATKSCVTDEWDCWYNFNLVAPTIVACVWQEHCTGPGLSKQHCTGLSFPFKRDMIEPDPTTPPDLTPPTPFDTLQDGVRNGPIFTMVSRNDPWDHALSRYSASIGTLQNKGNLNLSTLVMHGNEVRSRDEWSWNDSLWMAKLQAIPGQTIQISCRITNGSTYHRPTEIKTVCTNSSRPENYKAECYKITEPNSDCLYNLTFTKPVIVYCLWGLQRYQITI